jgi:dienelactone hydrolase
MCVNRKVRVRWPVWVSMVALALVGGLAARTAHAQPRMEVIPIQSMTLTQQQILTGEVHGKPATIAGELRLPRGGTDKLPAVILVHAWGGVLVNLDDWARQLNSWDVAVFIQDSLSGRGIVGGTAEDGQLSGLSRMIDSYRSLARLAQHPRIDPNRIAVMGFSYGTVAALWSSSERFRKLYGPPNTQFAAHIGLYAFCVTQYRDDDKVTGRPIRLFHGTGDDWNAIEPCRAYVARVKTNGADASLTEFPGATHAYDITTLKDRVALPKAVSFRHCSLVEGEGGQIINAKTGKLYDANDPCREQGVNIQYDEAATNGTREGVKVVLTSVFGLK